MPDQRPTAERSHSREQAFADLHCHPSFFAFNRLRHSSVEADGTEFDAWNVPPSALRPLARGGRAMRYSQCDFPKLHASGTRLVFASITPIERGFFGGGRRHPFAGELARWIAGVTPFEIVRNLVRGEAAGAAREAVRILRNRGPLRRALHRKMLGFPSARVDFLMSDAYDYWDEFEREYAFIRDGAARDVPLGAGGPGRYELVSDAAHLDEILAQDDGRIAVVLTIEGGHTFSLGAGDELVDHEVIFDRIDALRRWPHPILFVTLAHHFDNGLLGHARSLMDSGSLLLDQLPGMGRGFEEVGMQAALRLLGRNADLEPTGEQPIHIDLKHFSPRARVEYYDAVVRPLLDRGDAVPVIFSHVGYSGVRTLADLVAAEGKESDRWVAAGYNAWGINVCDEDIEMVFRTGGLLGLCLDRRIAGVAPRHAVPAEQNGRVLLRQIFGLVDAVLHDDRIPAEERSTIWDCIAIGSDFDGAIHPLSRYATAEAFPALADHLRAGLETWRHTRGIERLGVDKLVDKILWRNALDFARRTLPTTR